MDEKKTAKISIKEASEKARAHLAELTGFKISSVVGIKKEGEGWEAVVEMVEKEGIPDRQDVLGKYKVKLDARGGLVGYERIDLRKRGDTPVEIIEEEG